MIKLKNILIAIFLFYSAAIFAGQEALVIIDLQPYFAERPDYDKYPENEKIKEEVLKKAVETIEWAKARKLPIVTVEYESVGPSFKEIRDALKGYKNQILVEKTTDGLFDPENKSLAKVERYLKSKNVETLIMMGANGGACVKESINGALKKNYNVLAHTEAIADFNYEKIIYPYKHKYMFMNRFRSPRCPDCSFEEVHWLSYLDFQLGKNLRPSASTTNSINDSGRGTVKEVPSRATQVREGSASTTGR